MNASTLSFSSACLHHTKDAREAFASIVRKVKPGGLVVVGLYNWFARVPTAMRARLIELLGPKIDYVVRNRIRDPLKAEIWVKDQYYNPHETWHSIDEVMDWFRENNVAYLNCEPPIPQANGAGNGKGGMFAESDPRTKAARLMTQLSWLGSISAEARFRAHRSADVVAVAPFHADRNCFKALCNAKSQGWLIPSLRLSDRLLPSRVARWT